MTAYSVSDFFHVGICEHPVELGAKVYGKRANGDDLRCRNMVTHGYWRFTLGRAGGVGKEREERRRKVRLYAPQESSASKDVIMLVTS